MKIPYEKVFLDYGWGYNPVKLTGKCKSVTGGPYPAEYIQVQRYILGIPVWKSWVSKSDIVYFDKRQEKIYNCNCQEGNE